MREQIINCNTIAVIIEVPVQTVIFKNLSGLTADEKKKNSETASFKMTSDSKLHLITKFHVFFLGNIIWCWWLINWHLQSAC